MAHQAPALRRTEGDTGTLNGRVLTRTGISTTDPENLSGAVVSITIREHGGGILSLFNNVIIPAPDITDPTAGKFEYILSAPQVAQLVAGAQRTPKQYTVKLKIIYPSAEVRFYPNDVSILDGSVISDLVLEVLPAL
jgi:hypothetical protein